VPSWRASPASPGVAGDELVERVEASLERIARSALLVAWMVWPAMTVSAGVLGRRRC
jgi:hypothetical protein